MIWQQPDVLALDEPTNHIDADTRAMLLAALHAYHGIGLLVSHDERFLRRLPQMRRHTVPTPTGPHGRMLLEIFLKQIIS